MNKNVTMMLKSFTLNITDDCNLACIYCQQIKTAINMSESLIKKALNFFFPHLESGCTINFYGGEPLLALDRIKYAVDRLETLKRETGKSLQYSTTTNGVFLDNRSLEFFDRYGFALMLSFDGYAQEINRKKKKIIEMAELVGKALTYKGIKFTVNSVFTPETVKYLGKSVLYILDLGVAEPLYNLSTVTEWDEYALAEYYRQLIFLKDHLVSIYKRTGTIPLDVFKKKRYGGIFGCFAARDRMAVSADGDVWGCYLFPYFFKDKTDTYEYQKYFLGKLDDFIVDYQNILREKLPEYNNLRQSNFYTEDNFCGLCGELEDCHVCPITAARSGSILLGKIPPWICKINRIEKEIRARFHQEIISAAPYEKTVLSMMEQNL